MRQVCPIDAMQLYQEITNLLASGRRGALATVIGSRGSTPGKEGAKMLIRDDGTTVGTIGGGCTEAEVWALARDVMDKDRPLRQSFKLTPGAAAEEGLACGGIVEIFIEPLGSPIVWIFGAGHIGRMLTPLLKLAGFNTRVIDDREQFANRTLFPDAAEVIVTPFETCFEQLAITPSCSIVIVTRGHKYDQLVLSKAVRSRAAFVGLIGSRSKIVRIFRVLRNEGVSEERLRAVKAPIGLDIGARSPEEIAISIAAQLIAHRRRAFIKGDVEERRAEPAPLLDGDAPESTSGVEEIGASAERPVEDR
ncbi:MAG TPA: XdhC/CoxI family protein [Planctomycetota bacterium]|nr:XdhC/CoxI family protein [Planctomycetota bacterium]